MRDHPCTLHNPALISCSSPKEDPTPRAPNTSPSQRSNMSSISVCFHGTHHITEHKYWRASYVRSNIASTCEEIVPNILAFRREKKKKKPDRDRCTASRRNADRASRRCRSNGACKQAYGDLSFVPQRWHLERC